MLKSQLGIIAVCICFDYRFANIGFPNIGNLGQMILGGGGAYEAQFVRISAYMSSRLENTAICFCVDNGN